MESETGRYLLLIYGCERPEAEPERAVKREKVGAYLAECRRRGVLIDASPLHPAGTATTVRVRGGEPLITDGPFAETAEQLGGYLLLECGYDEAVELAARCPMAAEGSIEVRAVQELPDYAEMTGA